MQQFFPHRHSFSPAAQHLDPQRAFRGAKLPAHFAVALPVENQRPEATAFRRRRFENSQQEPLRFGTNDPTQRRRLVARLGLGKILREQRFVEASDRALERAIKLKRASEARAGVGLATQLDVLRADLMVSQAQASLASQRESLAGRLDQLKLLMGRHMDSPIEIAGDGLVELTREADGFVESPPAIPPTPVGLSRSNRERPTRLNVASYSDRTRIDELAALVRYERPAAIDRARAEIDRVREELSRQRTSAGARLAQRQAALKLAEAKVQELNARVAMLRDQIGRTVVRAQGPGLVVYRDLFFGSDRRKPQIGDEVWPNQPLLALPDSSQLTVETRVREIDLHKITARGRVIVRVDAYPDLRLRASVGLVGALAQEDVARAGTRFFPVTIALMDGGARLRPGMTAQVEIDVASIDRATIVPSQAVFEREGRRFCFVVRRGRPEQTPVTLAADNGIDAAIKQGLRAGDVVLLAEPATAGFEARP